MTDDEFQYKSDVQDGNKNDEDDREVVDLPTPGYKDEGMTKGKKMMMVWLTYVTDLKRPYLLPE